MNAGLEKYTVKLITRTPLFIGSGNGLRNKEFMLADGKFYFLSPERLFDELDRRNLHSRFATYMSTLYPLSSFVKINGINPEDICAYSFDIGDSEVNDENGEIKEFIKDAYGQPFVPGSSLKGAIRTALYGTELIRNGKNYWKDREGKPINLSKGTSFFSKIHGVNDQTRDFMRAIRVSDSRPLDPECLCLCNTYLYSPGGKAEKPVPGLTRECIRPGTVIEFDLVIDTMLLGTYNVTPKSIMDAVNTFGEFTYQGFYKKFFSREQYIPNTLFLGAGAGYQTKTVVYARGGYNANTIGYVSKAVLQRAFEKQNKHLNDVAIGMSPHRTKRTKLNGKNQNFGECEISIIPAK